MSAIIGHYLHFSFSDMLNMDLEEMEYFYEIAKKANTQKE